METNLQFWLNLVLIGGAIFVFWRSGANKTSTEVIATYREQVGQLKGELKEERDKRESLNNQLGHLRGEFEAQKKKTEEYQAILQNRNPEMQKFMEVVLLAVQENSIHIKETRDAMTAINTYINTYIKTQSSTA